MKELKEIKIWTVSLLLAVLVWNTNVFAQDTEGVAIGDSLKYADPSAILELFSNTKGFLPPRMTTAERDSIAHPASGLIVFDTDQNRLFCFHDGWQELSLWKKNDEGIYYTGGVAIGGDTVIFPLTIKGKQGISSLISGDTVPKSPMPISNGFIGNFTYNDGGYINTVVSSDISGTADSYAAGIAAWMSNNGAQTVGVVSEAYYTGAGISSLHSETVPMVAGYMGSAYVEDPNAVVVAIGNFSVASMDHKGLNIGLSAKAYSETTYGNIAAMNVVNVGEEASPYTDSLLSRFPDRVTITNLLYNGHSDSTDFNIYASGSAKNYFEGKVGIGTVSPQTELQVEGNFQATGATVSTITITDSLQLTEGAGEGYVMTSDSNGKAHWTDYNNISVWERQNGKVVLRSPGDTVVINQVSFTENSLLFGIPATSLDPGDGDLMIYGKRYGGSVGMLIRSDSLGGEIKISNTNIGSLSSIRFFDPQHPTGDKGMVFNSTGGFVFHVMAKDAPITRGYLTITGGTSSSGIDTIKLKAVDSNTPHYPAFIQLGDSLIVSDNSLYVPHLLTHGTEIAALAEISHSPAVNPDYSIQDFTQNAPYGFVSADEANTLMSVIKNLQQRVDELEQRIQVSQ